MFARASRRSRLAAAAAAVAALTAGMLSGAPSQSAHAATSFKVYNETQGDHAHWALDQLGLINQAVVYDRWNMSCTATSCSNVPSKATFESTVQSVVSQFGASASTPLALDFETILPVQASSTGEAQQDLDLFEQLVTWAHEAAPSAPIGMYSYDWKTNYNSYTKQLYYGGYLQFFAPSMYNRWDTVSEWKSELDAAVSNDKSLNANLPSYPFIWPQWHTSSDTAQLTSSEWTNEFTYLKSKTQGAIVWANSATTLDTTSCGWLSSLSYQMSIVTNDQSSGPLTVTATVPNTCEIPRGTTTSVPLTITNNGASTSAATTLAPVSGPQGITESYSATAIPALAAGESYSTTLNITVPSSVTDQTALLRINYGTGFRRITVIVT